MIRLLASLTALLYCFVWLRMPNVGGIDLPLQRLIAWLSIVALFITSAFTKKIYAGRYTKVFIAFTSVFIVNMFINLLWNIKDTSFGFKYFIMDFSKYMAAFSVAYLMYFALKRKIITLPSVIKYFKWSTAVAVFLTFLSLILFIVGFRTDNQMILRTWGSAWGVIPTGGILPRLAGTTSEPQQFSIIFLTPILLMLALNKGKLTLVPLLGIAALLMSQSKFSLLTVVIIIVFSFLLNKKRRFLYLYLGIVAVPFIASAIAKLPVFSMSLQQGGNSIAIQERLENATIMTNIIKNEFLFGIGAGQYGTYRSLLLPVEYNPSYYPNNDYLKVFAELGIIGFVVLIIFLGYVIVFSIQSYRKMNEEQKPFFMAVSIGTVVIALNMLIGYELLHIFFWVNLGILFFMGETFPQHSTDINKKPKALSA